MYVGVQRLHGQLLRHGRRQLRGHPGRRGRDRHRHDADSTHRAETCGTATHHEVGMAIDPPVEQIGHQSGRGPMAQPSELARHRQRHTQRSGTEVEQRHHGVRIERRRSGDQGRDDLSARPHRHRRGLRVHHLPRRMVVVHTLGGHQRVVLAQHHQWAVDGSRDGLHDRRGTSTSRHQRVQRGVEVTSSAEHADFPRDDVGVGSAAQVDERDHGVQRDQRELHRRGFADHLVGDLVEGSAQFHCHPGDVANGQLTNVVTARTGGAATL